jgi:succinate dehydrogenase/fumarate reductase flavoprotein subunit
MIPLWLGKFVATRVIKAIKYRIDLKRIDKYVNKPNELDKQMKQIVKTNSKILRENEEMQKDIAILKRDAHPPQEYICCRKCGCKIAKTKVKKRR